VDVLYYVLTPWLLGQDGLDAFRIPGVDALRDSIHFHSLTAESIGPDLLIKARPDWSYEG